MTPLKLFMGSAEWPEALHTVIIERGRKLTGKYLNDVGFGDDLEQRLRPLT